MTLPEDQLKLARCSRRAVLRYGFALPPLALLSACAPAAPSAVTPTTAAAPTAAAGASPAVKPAVSPSPAVSPAASPSASPAVAVASVAPAPTQGGVPPTVVGAATVSGTPAAQPAIPQEGGAAGSPVPAGSAAAASPSTVAGASPVAAAKPAATPTPTPAVTVTITPDRRFDPAQVTVNAGDSVLWRNTGRNPQTVTCDPIRAADKSHVVLPAGADPFDSGVINANASYSHRFDGSGSYTYFSIPFESQNMTGQVIVR